MFLHRFARKSGNQNWWRWKERPDRADPLAGPSIAVMCLTYIEWYFIVSQRYLADRVDIKGRNVSLQTLWPRTLSSLGKETLKLSCRVLQSTSKRICFADFIAADQSSINFWNAILSPLKDDYASHVSTTLLSATRVTARNISITKVTYYLNLKQFSTKMS